MRASEVRASEVRASEVRAKLQLSMKRGKNLLEAEIDHMLQIIATMALILNILIELEVMHYCVYCHYQM